MAEPLPASWPDDALAAPVLAARSVASGAVNLQVEVRTDCPWLEGHFPGQPVLPGVIQLRWALHLAQAVWPDLATVDTVSNLKFQQPVLPPASLLLELRRHPALARVDFCWQQSEKPCSRGRVSFS